MRVAVIVCGQMRSIETAIETWNEYLFSVYPDADVFVSTQDVNAVKGRIYTFPMVANQYVFQPIKYDIEEKLRRSLGARLKKVVVRRGLYHYYVSNQRSDFVLGNSLGWAENFRDMQIALEMAGSKYDLYIKIRPDICLCNPFYKAPDPVPENTMYVASRKRGFLWDAVFAMDRKMAHHILEFYDYYNSVARRGVDKSFGEWDYRLNAEEKLLEFANSKMATIVDMQKVGYPLTWLIGDIKNAYHDSLRHLDFSVAWKQKLQAIADRHESTTFDLCDATCSYPEMPKYVPDASKPKAALLICGMIKHARFCLPWIVENIASFYNCDVYVATQDCACVKPRKGTAKTGQYLVARVPLMRPTFVEAFGSALKGYHVRNTYDHKIANQGRDLVLDARSPWRDQYADVSKAFSMALESGDRYDLYIRVRPDSMLARPFNISYCPIERNSYFTEFSNEDCDTDAFAVDHVVAQSIAKFNEWYSELDIEAQEKPGARMREWLSKANARMIRVKNESISVEAMISDLRNEAKPPRHLRLEKKWSDAVSAHASKFRKTIFDLVPDEIVST